MPSSVPPGLPHVLRSLVYLSAPFLAVYVFSYFVKIPTWAFLVLQTVCLPIYLVACVKIKDFRGRRAAAHLGAIPPPSHDGESLGNIDILVKFQRIYKQGFLGDGVSEAHAELGGTFNLSILWDTTTVTNDVNVIKTVLATDFNNYVKGNFFQAFMYSVLGTGVFNADGMGCGCDFHCGARSITHNSQTPQARCGNAALHKMKERLVEGHAIDFQKAMQDLVSRFTLDSASEFLFGKCVNVLESPLPYPPQTPEASRQEEVLTLADKFARAFSRAQDTIAHRGRLGYIWPWLEIFNDKTGEDMEIVDSFLNPILEDALEKQRAEKKAGLWQDAKSDEVNDQDTFLDHLVRTTTDSQVIHDEILNILIAGRDTTAGTLTFAVYFLCMYPRVLERLRKEVLETVGYSRRPDYDDIKSMKYLRAFLNEVLRLYPAVPFNVRYAVNDTTVPNPDPTGRPFFVAAGQPKDYWGPDAPLSG
ncbi:cytochrome P450 [Cristinia sonorae]|uniref:Cytochrome P450 n=1 Tax=Cristinia sonorae TaxID=1940300 RepID=A0A8K0XTP0_9AGAR|nr:cytochrome P450 [Cristinia sonorae]